MRFFGSLRETLSMRDTPVGAGIPRAAGVVLAVLALAVTASDLHLVPWRTWERDPYSWTRAAAGAAVLVAIAAVVLVQRAPLTAIGLRRGLLPSRRFWFEATLALAVAFAVLAASMLVVHVARHGMVWPADVAPPTWSYAEVLCQMLVEAPLGEELLYRWMLVTALVTVLPRWATVIISGVAFGYLHVVYGVAAPNNLIAGFVFAWMYLKSGNILVPVAFHALGNAAVFAINLVTFWLIG